MDADVKQRAAAGDLLVREPAAGVPGAAQAGGLGVVDLAEVPGVDEGLQHLAVRGVAAHEADLDHRVVGLDDALELLRLGEGAGDRLLDQHVLARLDSGDRPLGVGVVPGADRDAVDLGIGEQLAGVGVGAPGAVLVGDLLGALEVHVRHGDQLDVGVLRVRGEVGLGDAPGADDADSERGHGGVFSLW